LLKRTAFQSLTNITWKVSSISVCMQVICSVFFSCVLKQFKIRFQDCVVAIQKINFGNTQYSFWPSVLYCFVLIVLCACYRRFNL